MWGISNDRRLRPIGPREEDLIEETRRAYREMWSKLRDVPPRDFCGTHLDIDALDFIDYEAGFHPNGLDGAAIIWAGVLVGTGILSWAVWEETELVVTAVADLEYPQAIIFPTARVKEINCAAVPPDGKYQWLLDETLVRLLSTVWYSDDHRKLLAALIETGYASYVDITRRGIDESSTLARKK